MSTKDWAGVTVGLALATFGLGAFVASGGGTAPAPAADPAPVVQTVSTVETTGLPMPDVTIPGLSASAGRVLQARGYAELAPQTDLGLPPAVQRVLESAGTVLLIPEGGGS